MLQWEHEVIDGVDFWYCFPWEITFIEESENAPYSLAIEGITDDADKTAFVDLAYLPTLEAAQDLAEELHQKMVDEFNGEAEVLEPSE